MKASTKFLSLLGSLFCLTLPSLAQSHSDSTIKDAPAQATESTTTRGSAQTNSKANSSSSMNNSAYGSNQVSTGMDTHRFSNLDKDSDGRISRSEFTLASPQLQNGQTETGKTEKKHWWNRNSSDKKATATTDSDVTSASSSVETFNQLDTNKDGFLSQTELDAQNAGNQVDVTK